MDQLSGLTRKNRLTCLVFRHSIIFSTSYIFPLLDFLLDVKYHEAVRNLLGKHAFFPTVLDSLLLRRKPHTAARAQMRVISGHGIFDLDFGWSFSDKEALTGGHFNKFHESNTKAVAKLKLNSTAANGISQS